MSRFTWKALGGIFPFVCTLMLIDLRYVYRTCFVVGASIIWANAVGYIEGHFRIWVPKTKGEQ